MTSPEKSSQAQITVGSCLGSFFAWCKREPLGALLLTGIIGTLVYFYGTIPIFLNGRVTAAFWAWDAWKPDMNQEHSKLVLPFMLGLTWYHRHHLRDAIGKGSPWGLMLVAFGTFLFVISARMIEARYSLLSVPFLLLGSIWWLFGWKAARVMLFTCAFFVFTIPMGAVEQATNKLQFIITAAVDMLSNLVGVKVEAVGTSLNAVDGTFNFEIAEGCSGVRSLIAMMMLAAVYVHVTQKELWKKIVIFAASGVFAIIGNIGRIFTVILVAKFGDKEIAAGIYHDYSGFVFFPFALLAMLGFSKLINKHYASPITRGTDGKPVSKESDKVTYDY